MAVRYSGLVSKPKLSVHCDWSTSATKRWAVIGLLSTTGTYEVIEPTLVGETDSFFARLREFAPTGPMLAGFDFPIIVPRAYAERAGFGRFPEMLLRLGEGPCANFYTPAERPDEISLGRPFYEPFSVCAETEKCPQRTKSLAFGARAETPVAVENVDVARCELVQHHIAA